MIQPDDPRVVFCSLEQASTIRDFSTVLADR